MYLSKIELHGFKSFADRTSLKFDDGITAIVGPNGCGKSNIVDAVRWVLGAQRPTLLRSDTMENVIFNGTTDRRALGMAEVELTIQNTRNVLPTEYTEVSVGRRLYRSGKSEYLLNGVEARLKDIEELFMDTGMGPDAYSVIELSMVDEILSNTSNNRRGLLEEAAGITKYKERRRQALRKLENTREDLSRVRDLTSELETRVDELEHQADRASQHAELSAELERLELQLAATRFRSFSSEVAKLEKKVERLRNRREELTTEKNQEEAELEKQRTAQTNAEQKLSKAQENLNNQTETIREMESDLRLTQERATTASEGIDRLEQEHQSASQRRNELVDEREQVSERLKAIKDELQAAQKQLHEKRSVQEQLADTLQDHQDALAALRQDEDDVQSQHQELQQERDRLENRIEMLDEERERIAQQQKEAREAIEEEEEHKQKLQTKLSNLGDELDQARERYESTQAQVEDLENKLAEAREKHQDLKRRQDTLAAEVGLLENLVNSYEEYGDAVQYLAKSDWQDDTFRTVDDIVACDDRDRLAVEAALGPAGSYVLSKSQQHTDKAVQLLREQEKGRATFLEQESLPSSTDQDIHSLPVEAEPVVTLVEPLEPGYKPVLHVLLRHSYVVDSLSKAREAAAHLDVDTQDIRFVTRNGEWVTARGVVHAGTESGDGGSKAHRLGRRDQLRQTRSELEAVEDQLARQKDHVTDLEDELEAIPVDEHLDEIENIKNRQQNLRETVRERDYRLETLRERLSEHETRLEEIAEKRADYRNEIDQLDEKIAEVATKQRTVREKREQQEEKRDEIESQHREQVEETNEVHLKVVQLENRCDNLENERQRLTERINELYERQERRRQEQEDLENTLTESKSKQAELQEKIEAAYSKREELEEKVKEIEEQVSQYRSAISGRETVLRDVQRMRENTLEEENEHARRLTRLETRLEDLHERIEEEYGVDLSEDSVEMDDEFSEQEAEQRIPTLRRELDKLGAVNELALETYEEERERLDFLRSQQDDLEEAEDTLLETISEINQTASEQFNETFTAVQDHFQELFSDLFGEGTEAHLFLDGEDPLEAPIGIEAQPRGKKPSTLAQLSGGEKALTAIALLFAIYLVKPSPFCILDEVDAPLDDANVHRFMNLIRRFSDTTQFIIITHNQLTMEAADRLYGVTMQELGVSTLVGVEFEEAVEMAG